MAIGILGSGEFVTVQRKHSLRAGAQVPGALVFREEAAADDVTFHLGLSGLRGRLPLGCRLEIQGEVYTVSEEAKADDATGDIAVRVTEPLMAGAAVLDGATLVRLYGEQRLQAMRAGDTEGEAELQGTGLERLAVLAEGALWTPARGDFALYAGRSRYIHEVRAIGSTANPVGWRLFAGDNQP